MRLLLLRHDFVIFRSRTPATLPQNPSFRCKTISFTNPGACPNSLRPRGRVGVEFRQHMDIAFGLQQLVPQSRLHLLVTGYHRQPNTRQFLNVDTLFRESSSLPPPYSPMRKREDSVFGECHLGKCPLCVKHHPLGRMIPPRPGCENHFIHNRFPVRRLSIPKML